MTQNGDNENESDLSEITDEGVRKLLRERKNLRRLFTIACDNFEKVEDKNFENLNVMYHKVSDKAERLFQVDSNLSEVMTYSDDDFDTIERYRDRFIENKIMYESILSKKSDDSVSSLSASQSNLQLPKLVLKEYDLTPKTWVAFWGQFSRIHDDELIREEDKFQYLLSCLVKKSKAREIADSYPPSKGNYSKVIEHLKSRFGRKDLLIEVYIRELLSLVMNHNSLKLSTLYDKLGTYLRALDTLDVTSDCYADMLYPVIESCLPIETLKAWDRHRLNKGQEQDSDETCIKKEKLLTNLMIFLGNEVKAEEHRALAESGFGSKPKDKRYERENEIASASALTSQQEKPNKVCIFCGKSHKSHTCGKATSMSIDEKRTLLFKKNCCFVCFSFGHRANSCRFSLKCPKCGRRHYEVMCPELDLKRVETTTSTSSLSSEGSDEVIYLKTLMVNIRNNAQQKFVRALLDDGSHRSYIESSLAEELQLIPSSQEVMSQSLFGGVQTAATVHQVYDVVLQDACNKSSCKVSLVNQDVICTALPRVRDRKLIDELVRRKIKLSDVGPGNPPFRILLGADALARILTGKIEVFSSGVTAIETKLGWSVLGSKGKKGAVNMVSLSMQRDIPKLWDLEVLGIKDPIEKISKKAVEEDTLLQFQETVSQDSDNRYEVTLPWLAGHPPLGNNYDIAERRLQSTTKKLLKDGNFEAYDYVLRQWKFEGIIETVLTQNEPNVSYYLPHRPVIKLSSATTKIRPVFDASSSSRQAGSVSLNECLSVGPSLTSEIFPLLIKFRLGAIGLSADIKQAFLQLSLKLNSDRDVLRFLWWKDETRSEIETFRHCRVVFGVSSSPFLLNATIKHHLSLEKYQDEDFRLTIGKMRNGFYVDNLVTSVADERELRQVVSQAKEIMDEGKFELRCWAHTGDSNEEQMILGLKWNTTEDNIRCIEPKKTPSSLTKRTLVSIVNSVYDPLGLVSPVLLLPKLILQEAWKLKFSWDTELPEEFQLKFKKWIKELSLIHEVRVPRRLLFGEAENATLHIFVDGSKSAYACCAYIRSVEEGGEVSVRLVASRSRVAPIERPTIPRMELLAAVIGARLARTILQSVEKSLRYFLWSDSIVVLSWIKESEPWNTFVGNRVKEIRSLTEANNWRFVPGEKNPADLPSRSCCWKEFVTSRWWEGPAWLLETECCWPTFVSTPIPEEALIERKKTVVATATVIQEHDFSARLGYFSAYRKIVRMVAWMMRFISNCKLKTKKESNLSGEEIMEAEKVLIKVIQSEWWLKNKDKYCKSVQFVEKEDLLRVRTRLILTEEPEDFTCPIVLPDHPIVRRLIEQTHKEACHSGVQCTLSALRRRYWIPRGRRVVREVLYQCMPCKRFSSKRVEVEVSPLPNERVKRVSAFQVTGSDLAGPLYLKKGEKAWIVLFTCGVYRAIHLELVTSLSSELFLQALRRFIARRGRPSIMYTDNGTNFVGAARSLQELDWKRIEEECALHQIKWRFSPPSAPWYGGWWERLVRFVKELLRKTLGRACLNYEEMATVLCDIEATINSRPLTYLYDDPNELKAITPAHFIQDIQESKTEDIDAVDGACILRRAHYLQSLRQKLRRRFKEEYLGELVKNPPFTSKRQEISPGDIVLVGSDNQKRLNWPIAQVLELYPGRDNIRRVAKLRMATGELIRPLQRLYPLELSVKQAEDRIELSGLEQRVEKIEPTQQGLANEIDFDHKCEKTRSGRIIKVPVKLDL